VSQIPVTSSGHVNKQRYLPGPIPPVSSSQSAPSPGRPLRVEQALRLLPDVEDLAPLRGLIVSSTSSRGVKRESWGAVEPNRTVGKRTIDQSSFRAGVPQLVTRSTKRVAILYDAAAEALESEQNGDLSQAVRALIRGGECEQEEIRYTQAQAWYSQALGIAEQLRDRRPEMEALWRLGRLETSRGYLDEGARAFQRGLALAEAESDHAHAARACQGLGDVLYAQAQWEGAEAWFNRGLQLAKKTSSPALAASLLLSLGRTALRRGEPDSATAWLTRALESFEAIGDAVGIVQTLLARALVEAAQGRLANVLLTYRDALSRAPSDNADLEVTIRLALTEFHLDVGRLHEAEDEGRRAENIAIACEQRGALARAYMLLGRLRARQKNEEGFVFYEQAIELCRSGEPGRRTEVEVYREYAQFRLSMGDRQEARAYLERARELVEPFNDDLARREIDEQLRQLDQ